MLKKIRNINTILIIYSMAHGYRYSSLFLDEDKQYRMRNLSVQPWILINLLPVKITISTLISGRLVKVVDIKALGHVETKNLSASDIIYATIDMGGKNYQCMEPITLIGDSRVIKIGDIVYKETTNTLVQRGHSDIMGLRIINHLPVGVDVYWIPGTNRRLRNGGNVKTLLAHIGKSDGTGYMSGSISSTYITNERFGFNIDDELEFIYYVDDKSLNLPIKIKIIDNYMTTIHIGVITQSFNPPIRDMFSYRIDEPSITGISRMSWGVKYPISSLGPGKLEYINY